MTQPTGGRLSQNILASLNAARYAGIAAAHASRAVGELQWRPAQVGTIACDDQRATWQTGNVQAVLSDGNAIIAGTQTGGAWLINPVPSPSYRDGYRAIPLSDRWDTPNVYALAYGPDGTHDVFVGCGEADSLHLVQLEATLGALIVQRSDAMIPLPWRTSIGAIVVIEASRRIVIGTGAGAFWSDIPAKVDDVAGYAWHAAAGLPAGRCGAIARGPGTSLAVSGAEASGGPLANPHAPPPIDRLFVGDWAGDVLSFTPAAVPDIATADIGGFVIASCRSAPERMYATAIDGSKARADMIRCVLRSDDGGAHWQSVAIPDGAGEQGGHNRAIGVSAYRPDVVALGWQTAGPFLSVDGGLHWAHLDGGNGIDANGLSCHGGPAAIHTDLHDVHFPPNALQADHLIVASDGGIVLSRDLGRCFDSEFNRALEVLQFYRRGLVHPAGTLSVSSRFPGLVAGGTQDNGNVTLHPDTDAGPVWHRLVGGDGGMTRFVDPLGLLLHRIDGQPQIRMATWNDGAGRFAGGGPVVPRDGDAGGLAPNALEAVVAPSWRRGGQLLYACAGSSNGDLHGFFANADGTQASFLHIANVGTSITAVASLTGSEVVIGCGDGRILALETMTGLWREQPRAADAAEAGSVTHLELLSRDVAYAFKVGRLVRWDVQQWSMLPDDRGWVAFTADASTGRLFACTDTDVFASSDGGQTWTDASVGLPVAPHCSELRIGTDPDGGSSLYLATYGRSLWRAQITLAPDAGPNYELPPRAREVLLRLIPEEGAVARLGGELVRIEGGALARDLLGGLAVEAIARRMSPEAGRGIRRAALEEMQKAIARAIERL